MQQDDDIVFFIHFDFRIFSQRRLLREQRVIFCEESWENATKGKTNIFWIHLFYFNFCWFVFLLENRVHFSQQPILFSWRRQITSTKCAEYFIRLSRKLFSVSTKQNRKKLQISSSWCIKPKKREECNFSCICYWVKKRFAFVLTQKYPHILLANTKKTMFEFVHQLIPPAKIENNKKMLYLNKVVKRSMDQQIVWNLKSEWRTTVFPVTYLQQLTPCSTQFPPLTPTLRLFLSTWCNVWLSIVGDDCTHSHCCCWQNTGLAVTQKQQSQIAMIRDCYPSLFAKQSKEFLDRADDESQVRYLWKEMQTSSCVLRSYWFVSQTKIAEFLLNCHAQNEEEEFATKRRRKRGALARMWHSRGTSSRAINPIVWSTILSWFLCLHLILWSVSQHQQHRRLKWSELSEKTERDAYHEVQKTTSQFKQITIQSNHSTTTKTGQKTKNIVESRVAMLWKTTLAKWKNSREEQREFGCWNVANPKLRTQKEAEREQSSWNFENSHSSHKSSLFFSFLSLSRFCNCSRARRSTPRNRLFRLTLVSGSRVFWHCASPLHKWTFFVSRWSGDSPWRELSRVLYSWSVENEQLASWSWYYEVAHRCDAFAPRALQRFYQCESWTFIVFQPIQTSSKPPFPRFFVLQQFPQPCHALHNWSVTFCMAAYSFWCSRPCNIQSKTISEWLFKTSDTTIANTFWWFDKNSSTFNLNLSGAISVSCSLQRYSYSWNPNQVCPFALLFWFLSFFFCQKQKNEKNWLPNSKGTINIPDNSNNQYSWGQSIFLTTARGQSIFLTWNKGTINMTTARGQCIPDITRIRFLARGQSIFLKQQGTIIFLTSTRMATAWFGKRPSLCWESTLTTQLISSPSRFGVVKTVLVFGVFGVFDVFGRGGKSTHNSLCQSVAQENCASICCCFFFSFLWCLMKNKRWRRASWHSSVVLNHESRSTLLTTTPTTGSGPTELEPDLAQLSPWTCAALTTFWIFFWRQNCAQNFCSHSWHVHTTSSSCNHNQRGSSIKLIKWDWGEWQFWFCCNWWFGHSWWLYSIMVSVLSKRIFDCCVLLSQVQTQSPFKSQSLVSLSKSVFIFSCCCCSKCYCVFIDCDFWFLCSFNNFFLFFQWCQIGEVLEAQLCPHQGFFTCTISCAVPNSIRWDEFGRVGFPQWCNIFRSEHTFWSLWRQYFYHCRIELKVILNIGKDTLGFDTSGPVTLSCNSEQYTFADNILLVTHLEESGDCFFHDALLQYKVSLNTIDYNPASDSITVHVSCLWLPNVCWFVFSLFVCLFCPLLVCFVCLFVCLVVCLFVCVVCLFVVCVVILCCLCCLFVCCKCCLFVCWLVPLCCLFVVSDNSSLFELTCLFCVVSSCWSKTFEVACRFVLIWTQSLVCVNIVCFLCDVCLTVCFGVDYGHSDLIWGNKVWFDLFDCFLFVCLFVCCLFFDCLFVLFACLLFVLFVVCVLCYKWSLCCLKFAKTVLFVVWVVCKANCQSPLLFVLFVCLFVEHTQLQHHASHVGFVCCLFDKLQGLFAKLFVGFVCLFVGFACLQNLFVCHVCLNVGFAKLFVTFVLNACLQHLFVCLLFVCVVVSAFGHLNCFLVFHSWKIWACNCRSLWIINQCLWWRVGSVSLFFIFFPFFVWATNCWCFSSCFFWYCILFLVTIVGHVFE